MKNSISPLIQFDVGHDPAKWAPIQKACSVLSDWGLENLTNGLGKYVGTVLLEPRYVCKDHRNLFSNFYSKKMECGSPECSRLHFFSKSGISVNDFMAEPTGYSQEYLGYSVVRPVAERSLGRTVIDPEKVGKRFQDGFYCLRTPFLVHLNGKNLNVSGYPYLSQDTDATVCAHATLWGVCRYFSERYSSYAQLLPYDLVKLTATTTGRVVPYRGMTYSDYSKILSDFGCHPLITRIKTSTSSTSLDVDAFDDVYSYVESGVPVLASFGGHVAALIGHTSDFTRTFTPDNKNIVSSSAFLKQFVVMDDNFFPYQLLGYPGDKENYFAPYPPHYDINSIVTAVCPLPEKVYLPASGARKQARAVLNQLLAVHPKSEFSAKDDHEPMVSRLFFTTGSSWKRRKLASAIANPAGFDRICAFTANIHLPHFVWIMEIAPHSLYQKGLCSAEIALDATANQLEHFPIYARVGSNLLLDGKKNKISSNPITFQQYTHNLGEA